MFLHCYKTLGSLIVQANELPLRHFVVYMGYSRSGNYFGFTGKSYGSECIINRVVVFVAGNLHISMRSAKEVATSNISAESGNYHEKLWHSKK